MSDINCPYCDAEQEINHDDGYGYTEEEIHQQQCGECDKYFTFTTSISFYYEAEKADCLNGAEHDFQPTHTQPVEYTKMRCSMCDESRNPTESEMAEIINNRK
jgi:hypothetical protein